MLYCLSRVVIAVSALTLILPPGWCSFVSFKKVEPRHETPTKVNGNCCDLCHCRKQEKPPAPIPELPPRTRCCCYELDWLKPPLSEQVDDDLTFSVPLDLTGQRFAPYAICAAADLSLPVPSPPLHVLKCVWLC